MSPTDDRKLKQGDSVYLDGGGVLQGYNADTCRMSVLGEPEAEHSAVYETVKETQRAMIDVIRPGIPCCEIYKTGRSLYKKEGLGYMVSTRSFGHGVGLNVHEMPDMSLENDEPLQEGMVLSIEPWIIERDGLGVFNYEDMVVVRKNGAELLSEDFS
ncbi:MAG: aminopeptidase P family protein [Phycisphaerae bacterium]|nr:aminopeptidase P family protein [Phycisphaerae bacterium]